MPKIIENVREQLIAEAKKQVRERGYKATTIRSIAAECGIGVGTVYNYFDSKDTLIASFMAEDWQNELGAISRSGAPSEVVAGIIRAILAFSERYDRLFCDKDAAKVFASVFSVRHRQLREQIAGLIYPLCREEDGRDFLCEYIAESLLTWTLAGKSFDEQFAIIEKLL